MRIRDYPMSLRSVLVGLCLSVRLAVAWRGNPLD